MNDMESCSKDTSDSLYKNNACVKSYKLEGFVSNNWNKDDLWNFPVTEMSHTVLDANEASILAQE